ncbi:hypothetical protein [Shivajiella indica]|uniref:Uncharacterized protein n=1 Tax=Shivajiella indica TaxID=872115 RepID=A0ABW5B792_9BACT
MKWDYTCKDCGVNTKKGKINFYGVTEELWGKYGVEDRTLRISPVD